VNKLGSLKSKLAELSRLASDVAHDIEDFEGRETSNSRLEKIDASLEDIRRLVGPFAVPMPNDTMLVQTLHGVKYLIDPKDLIMAPQLIVYRQWEADLTEYFLSIFTPDTQFVDVGANFGYFTCLAGSRIGTSGQGKIVAFEPNPHLFKLLQSNCTINWSMSPISTRQAAVAQEAGELDLWIPEDRAANASLSAAAGGKPFKVEVVTLDSAIGDSIQIDLLKIDVEGHEAGVLLGAKQLIKRSKNIHIVMEWSQIQMQQAGISSETMSNIFDELGLVAYHLPKTKKATHIPFDRIELIGTPYTNLLLKHK
jgi:FkbM family methyltransferase